MPKNAHHEAASHHENAAKAHRTAAEHHGKGNHEEGKKHSAMAHEHSGKAHEASKAAHQKSQHRSNACIPLFCGTRGKVATTQRGHLAPQSLEYLAPRLSRPDSDSLKGNLYCRTIQVVAKIVGMVGFFPRSPTTRTLRTDTNSTPGTSLAKPRRGASLKGLDEASTAPESILPKS